LYHVVVHPLAQRVLVQIRRREALSAGDRVGIAVSGGIDSVALLRLLLELRGELGIVLSLLHFNHKLRGAESDGDAEFVANLAREHGLDFLCDNGDVAGHASREGVSLEAAARELRYVFFRHLLNLEGVSGANAQDPDRAAAPKDEPQGLESKPSSDSVHGREGPLFHGASGHIDSSHTDVRDGHSDDGDSGHTASGQALSGSAGEARILCKIDKIVTGHTLDDQAETVLMRMIRGSGLRGIGGIHPRLAVEEEDGEVRGEIIRPLLDTRRRDLEQYLKEIGQDWREDSTNADPAFTRNRVRSLLVPLIEKEFNPAVAENLAELSEIARGEEEYWENEVAGWMGTAVHWVEPEWAKRAAEKTGLVQISSAAPSAETDLQAKIDRARWLVANASVSRPWLLSEPIGVQRRVVKAIGEHAGIPLEFKHVEEILRFAAEDAGAGRELSLPLGWKLRWCHAEVEFVTPDLRSKPEPKDYEYDLPVPGRLVIAELSTAIETARIPAAARSAYNPDELLSADSLRGRLTVRNWRSGDRFWPIHTKSPKKIKELLQERHVSQEERFLWPVVSNGEDIVWLRGFPVHAKYRAEPGDEAVRITEIGTDES